MALLSAGTDSARAAGDTLPAATHLICVAGTVYARGLNTDVASLRAALRWITAGIAVAADYAGAVLTSLAHGASNARASVHAAPQATRLRAGTLDAVARTDAGAAATNGIAWAAEADGADLGHAVTPVADQIGGTRKLTTTAGGAAPTVTGLPRRTSGIFVDVAIAVIVKSIAAIGRRRIVYALAGHGTSAVALIYACRADAFFSGHGAGLAAAVAGQAGKQEHVVVVVTVVVKRTGAGVAIFKAQVECIGNALFQLFSPA